VLTRTALLAACCTLLIPRDSVAQRSTVAVRALPGLHRVEVTVPEGRIAVNIPDDLAPGGLFTATVARLPRSGGAIRLNALSVEIPALRPGPIPDRFEFLIDANTPREIRIEVRETESGALLGEATVPVRARPVGAGEALPTVGQIGTPIRVRGTFDGNMANTAAVVGGRETVLLAESPRQLVLDTPDAPLGPGEIVVREQDRVLRGSFRVVSITVTPAPGPIGAEARRTLDVQVAGLAELEAPMPLRIQVSGPVTVEGGREQRLDIRAANVLPDGRWSLVRNMVALDSGDVSVSTTIGTDLPAPLSCPFSAEPLRVSTAFSGRGTIWSARVETALGEKRRLWLEGARPNLRAGQWISLRNCRLEEGGDVRTTGWTIARDPRRR
jgi:hypothetical protein